MTPSTLRNEPPDARPHAEPVVKVALSAASPADRLPCAHCGEPCSGDAGAPAGATFCCAGCRAVHALLTESGLAHFYRLERYPGVRVAEPRGPEHWRYLDTPEVADSLLDYRDGTVARVTWHVPAMHCVACVWLLENLFRLHPGIGESRVHFPRREVLIQFYPERVRLSEVVGLLSSIGYEPQLTLATLDRAGPDPRRHRLRLQVGVAGFAFGNIMLFSLPAYLGLDPFSGPTFRWWFGYLSLVLALPVLVYSAADYWLAAWLAFRQRVVTLDVPIALGLTALFAQSAYEIVGGHGEGYLDSLAGLIFFLLCGKMFQQKTYQRLAFDRDYRSFFPLSVTRKRGAGEEVVMLSQLEVGDHLVIRHGQLIPADARLLEGQGIVDYSFVTGESVPAERAPGDYLYAGGQQLGGAIEVQTVKPVSQSYLTSLWSQEPFRGGPTRTLQSITDRYSRHFTATVIAVAVGAALFWLGQIDPGRAVRAFTAVLIVACPCALALAAPFALGTALRWLTRQQIYLRQDAVLEGLARVNTVALDKTGTLTTATTSHVSFHGAALSPDEEAWVYSLTRHSVHPHAVRIGEMLAPRHFPHPVQDFAESPGLGMRGCLGGHTLLLGSSPWLTRGGVPVRTGEAPGGSMVHLAVDGIWRGAYELRHALRPEAGDLLRRLAQRYSLVLISGDNGRDRDRFEELLGPRAELYFEQSPLDKLNLIRGRQRSGAVVLMVGDGLNDAGALRQSEVGLAVVERLGAFSPASDGILRATEVAKLFGLLTLARRSVLIVRLSFILSALYNLVGVSIAAAGVLSPLICAVLMPLSSVSVVLFASGTTQWTARRLGLDGARPGPTLNGRVEATDV